MPNKKKMTEMGDINKSIRGDLVYTAIKSFLGSVPVVGASASEFFGLLIKAPLEKRKEDWTEAVGHMLLELWENQKIDFEALREDDQFIDTVFQATAYAIKTSEQVKLRAFQNAIINTSLGLAPDKATSQIFLNLIDSFTVLHIQLLNFINDPEQWFKKKNQKIPNWVSTSMYSLIYEAFPELKSQGELLNYVWADLIRAGFHDAPELATTLSGSGVLSPRTSRSAKLFLKYITNPGDPK